MITWQIVHWTGEVDTSFVIGCITAATLDRARWWVSFRASKPGYPYKRDSLRLRHEWPPKRRKRVELAD